MNNFEISLERVKKNGRNLENVSKELKNNFEIVFEAVKNNGMSLKYASSELKNNFDIVLEALKNNKKCPSYVTILEFASEELKNNFEIVLESVKNDGLSLNFASKELKNNYKIVLESVKSHGNSLKYASNDLKNNYSIVLEAIKTDLSKRIYTYLPSFIYASEMLQQRKDLIYFSLSLMNYYHYSTNNSKNIYFLNGSYKMAVNYFKCFADSIGSFLFFIYFDYDLIFIFLH
jgi:uncharacterized protein YcgL (UPF0745 family)